MTCILLEKIDLPKRCWLGATIFKKQFLNARDLSSADKKLLSKDINKVIWQASLKPSTINMQAYKDEIREYGEVEIIEVLLNDPSRVKRIAELVMRSIPYPMLVQVTHQDTIMIASGHSRISLSDNSRNTIEEFLLTDWINLKALTTFQKTFFSNIHSSKLSFTNFYRFYDSFVDQVILLNASKWADYYLDDKNPKEVKQISDQISQLELKIEEMQAALKKQTQFNRKVDLNVKIKASKEKVDLVKDYFIKNKV